MDTVVGHMMLSEKLQSLETFSKSNESAPWFKMGLRGAEWKCPTKMLEGLFFPGAVRSLTRLLA